MQAHAFRGHNVLLKPLPMREFKVRLVLGSIFSNEHRFVRTDYVWPSATYPTYPSRYATQAKWWNFRSVDPYFSVVT